MIAFEKSARARPVREVLYGEQAELRLRREAPLPELRNVGPVLELDRPMRFVFRGRAYVADVSYAAGLELFAVRRAAEVAAQALEDGPPDPLALAAYRLQLRRAAAIAHRVARPAGLRRWLPFRPNPFRHATEWELRDLMGFFSGARTRSSVRPSGLPR